MYYEQCIEGIVLKVTQDQRQELAKFYSQVEQRAFRMAMIETRNTSDALPEHKKNKIQNRLQRWSSMTPEEKRAMQQKRKKFKSLPEEEREKIKRKYHWYKDLPPEKQKELRHKWEKQNH